MQSLTVRVLPATHTKPTRRKVFDNYGVFPARVYSIEGDGTAALAFLSDTMPNMGYEARDLLFAGLTPGVDGDLVYIVR